MRNGGKILFIEAHNNFDLILRVLFFVWYINSDGSINIAFLHRILYKSQEQCLSTMNSPTKTRNT